MTRMSSRPESPTVPLRQNPDYIKYWLSRFFAVFGSQVTYISFPLLALSLSASPLGASVVTAVTYGVPFIISVPAGYIADRLPRRTVMLVADLGNAAVFVTVAILTLQGSLNIPILTLAAGLVAASSSAYLAAATAILPAIVGETQVRRAVSVNDSRDFAIALAGPVIGAALFIQGDHYPFLVNGAALLISGFLVSMLRVGRTSTSMSSSRPGQRAALVGIAIVWHDKSLRVALTLISLLSFVLTLNFFSLIAFFEGRGETISSGILVASQALGGLLGGIAAAWLSQQLRPRPVFLAQGTMWLITGLSMVVWQEVWVTALVLTLTWATTPSMRAVYQGYIAHVVPDEERGRVASAAILATSTMSPLGVLVAGALSGGGSVTPFVLVAVVAGIATVGLLFTTLRDTKEFLHVPA